MAVMKKPISETVAFVLTVFILGALAGGIGFSTGLFVLGLITDGVTIQIGGP